MGGVDFIDKLLTLTETVRKSMKWYKKLFLHLVDMVLVNAHAMYNMNDNRLSFFQFRLKFVADILQLNDELNESNEATMKTFTYFLRQEEKVCAVSHDKKKS